MVRIQIQKKRSSIEISQNINNNKYLYLSKRNQIKQRIKETIVKKKQQEIKKLHNKFIWQQVLLNQTINKKQTNLNDNQINQLMHHNNNTYSLQNILNQPIDPNLCKRILQQIKSPLMQQSFAMTNDESLSQSWINPPKRPNIPPSSSLKQQNVLQSRRPNIKSRYGNNNNDQYNNNNVQSFYEIDHNYSPYQNQRQHHHNQNYSENINFLQNITQRYDSQVVQFNNKHTFDVQSGFLNNGGDKNIVVINRNRNYINNNNNVESIVSPLDPNITMKRQQQQNSFNIVDNIWSQCCGGLFNTGKQVQHQLYYEEQQHQHGRSKSHQRKKIFDSKAQSLLQSTRKNPYQRNKKRGKNHNRIESILLIKEQQSHIEVDHSSSVNNKASQLQQPQQKPLKQVLSQLKLNHHLQTSHFIQLICTTIDLLKKAQTDKQFILENVQILTQLSSAQQNDLTGLIIGQDRYSRFLSRMNFVSLADMLRKLSKTKLIKEKNIDVKQYQRLKNKVSQSLENMLLNYSQIQKMLEEYVNKKDSIQGLKKVYKLLREKFYYLGQTKSTLQQLQMVMEDVRLFKHEGQVGRLEYIWEGLTEKVLSEQEFISCVVRGNGVYGRLEDNESRLQKNNESILAESRNRLQYQLSKMGFMRN